MTCVDIDGILLEYFEGDLDEVARRRLEAHAASCARCSGLVRDVNGIRTEAASLREMVPSRDLWQGIEARIQPAVVPIAAVPRPGISRKWMVAAAAALVVSTASITWLAASRSLAGRVAEATPPNPPQAASAVAMDRRGVASDALDAMTGGVSGTEGAEGGTNRGSIGGSAAARLPRLAAASDEPAAAAADLAYGAEIRQLQSVLAERRQELDPATVKIVEDNLRLIDIAVRQARAALAADPASAFLADQLNKALEKKAGLLRTVALLPAST